MHHHINVYKLFIIILLDNYLCLYELEEKLARTDTMIWTVYVVLAEIMVRFGPCILLITLNILMIRDFHLSLNRRLSLATNYNETISQNGSRKRKTTISSYVQSFENDDRVFDSFPIENYNNALAYAKEPKDQSLRPLVINVSFV